MGPLKLGILEADLPEWIAKYKERLKVRTPMVDLYDGVKETLLNLNKNGKRLALLSSSQAASIEPALDRHNLRDLFEVFLYADDVQHHKPRPEIIEKALKLMGGNKNKSIIVGDSKSDLGAAINAGIDYLLFHPKHNEK